MSVVLFADQGTPLSESGWPSWLGQEINVIRGVGSVGTKTVAVRKLGDGRVAVLFCFDTPRPPEARTDTIKATEPIALVYASHSVGRVAPTLHSNRGDFPRDLQHTNPVSDKEPVSFCLSRAGIQSVYDRFGVRGVLERLYQWFLDASIGELNSDGWEPMPPASNHWIAQTDTAWFQEYAHRQTTAGWIAGVARTSLCKALPERLTFDVNTDALDPLKPAGKSALAQAIDTKNTEWRGYVKAGIHDGLAGGYVPWVFVWSDPAKSDDVPFSIRCATVRDLRHLLRERSLRSFQDALAACQTNGCTCAYGGDEKMALVMVGVWRPKPLIETFGLSKDDEARRLEVCGYAVHWPRSKSLFDDESPITELAAYPIPSNDLFARVSNGATSPRGVCIAGYGALGSAFADFLARSGVPICDVIDADIVLAHNLARHSAVREDILSPKAAALRRLTLGVSAEKSNLHFGDVTHLGHDEAAGIAERSSVLIDATAEERVRRFLDDAPWAKTIPLLRAEIFDEGRIGALFISTGDRRTKLVDLYFALCWHAMECDAVASWLRRDADITPDSMELRLGISCASPTVRMPKSTVVLHAAAMMPVVRRVLDRSESLVSGVGINVVSDAGHPAGWVWLDVPQFEPLPSAESWDVRIHPSVRHTINEERAQARNDETGGYLYGGWHLAERRIVIVAASRRPPQTKASPTQLLLGPSGQTREERRIAERCGGRIHLVGSWHSHPQGSTELSVRDEETLQRFRAVNVRRGEPTLAVVAASGELRAHVRW